MTDKVSNSNRIAKMVASGKISAEEARKLQAGLAGEERRQDELRSALSHEASKQHKTYRLWYVGFLLSFFLGVVVAGGLFTSQSLPQDDLLVAEKVTQTQEANQRTIDLKDLITERRLSMNKSIAFFAGLVALGVFLLIGVVGVISYNSLVGARERVNSNWAQVENVYQRRLDLVPLLVNAVKSYVEHEQATLEGVTEARARALGAMQALKGSAPDSLEKLKALESAQADLGGALGRLLAVSENYPDLKASQNFLALQDQIEGTENRIAVERRNFNESSRAYNTRIQRFPSLVFAQAFGFDAKPYFQASSDAMSPLKDPFKGE